MADSDTSAWQPSRERVLWLAGALVLVVLPHATRVPTWVALTFFLLAGWRISHVLFGTPVPGRAARLAINLSVLSGILFSHGTLLGLNAGVSLLAALAGLKLLETGSLRDAYVLTFLGYFLVITNFLFSQTIPMGLYMLVVVVVLTATLITLNTSPEVLPARPRLKLAASLLVQSLPMMLVLFFLFPRIAGPLWALPKDARGAVSGLSDSMAPGSISNLGLSDAVAFRVEFTGEPPAPTKRYWRGPVLWHTDGRRWTMPKTRARAQPALEEVGDPFEYAVTLEPHFNRWLFAMDMVATIPPGATMSEDFQLRARRRVEKRFKYTVRSYTQYRNSLLRPRHRDQLLHVPAARHRQARAQAERWRAEHESDQAVVDEALLWFRTEPFYYTLRPPVLTGDTVDEFLFGTRRGFCEHYAAAFVVLMRAAGIPARVVTGYQGGEVNPLGNYMIVRQRDAHAWAEVWLGEARGWVRVDPTAAVSPSRVEAGLQAALPSPSIPERLGLESIPELERMWRTIRLGWDSVNNTWNQWVLGYGPVRQQQLLWHVGVDATDWKNLAVAILGCVGSVLLGVGLWVLRARGTRDPVERAYRRFCRKMDRLGAVRHPHEGPTHFAERIKRAHPGLAVPVGRITALYVALRYGCPRSSSQREHDIRALDRATRAFPPRQPALTTATSALGPP